MYRKMFSIFGVHIPRKKSVSLKTKWMEETMIFFIKIQPENMKMTWNISLFIFCMIFNLSKCNGVTVLWITSIK